MKLRYILFFLVTAIACSVALILWKTELSSGPVSAAKPVAADSTGLPDPENPRVAGPGEVVPMPAVSNSMPAAAKITGPPTAVVYTTAELLEKIRTALSSTNAADRDEVFTNLLPILVRQDAKAAAELVEALDPGPLREEALRQVAHLWTAQDADSALAWAAQLPDGAERKSSLGDALLQLGQSDPAKAMALVGTYGLDESGDLRANLAQSWAEKDWVAALTWVQANPAAVLQQDQIMARMAFVLAKTLPAEAANFVVAQIPPGPSQTEAAMSVLHQWGLQDMAGARAWLVQFPDGPLHQQGQQELDGIATYLNAMNQRP